MSHFANCSGFNENQVTTLVALRGGTSAVAAVATIILLVVTIVCHARLDKIQRLGKVHLFALFGVSISYLTVLSLGVVYHLLPDPIAGKWCAAFGFFHQILSVIQTTLLFTTTYPILVCLSSRESKENTSRKMKRILQGLMGAIIVLAALIVTLSFVPFLTGTYGEIGGWCWIFSIDEDCKVLVVGLIEQMFLWIIYHALISLICILMVMAAVVLLLRACLYKIKHFKEVQDSHKHISIKYIFQLIILVPIFVNFGDFVLVAHVHHYSFTKWMLFAIAPPISGLAIPLSFLLYIKFCYAGIEDKQVHTQVNPSANGLQSKAHRNQHHEQQVTQAPRGHNAHSAADMKTEIQREDGSYYVISSKYTNTSSHFVTADDNQSWAKERNTEQMEKQKLLRASANIV